MNILDYVKPLVEIIYRREPYYDNDIVVQPNEIVIKETGRFSRVTTRWQHHGIRTRNH